MKKILLFLFIFIIGFFAGFLVFFFYNKNNQVVKNCDQNQVRNEIINEITQRGLLSPSGNNNYYKDIVNGEITAINKDLISVKITPFEIISRVGTDMREIKISNETKIIKTEKKSEEQYNKEVKEYYDKHPDLKNSGFFPEDYPSMFFEKNVSIEALMVGQRVTVKATEEDITNKKFFTAKEISILYIK